MTFSLIRPIPAGSPELVNRLYIADKAVPQHDRRLAFACRMRAAPAHRTCTPEMTEDAQTPAKNPAKALCNFGCRCLTSWSLTPAEQDVANFTVKGYSISEIAQMRTSAEATIKTHRNAIWRKAGLAGRGQPVSLSIEDLLHAPIIVGTDVGGHASPVGSAVRN